MMSGSVSAAHTHKVRGSGTTHCECNFLVRPEGFLVPGCSVADGDVIANAYGVPQTASYQLQQYAKLLALQ